ncbi:Crp/Fnr family transcriptional regulator [Sedimentitalea todarodis]|uniref:Crp/Fnr family transcriptional regulator n=1 Tax=Sedimentitalea todarodis TaxID=1631240 RepID=A0ABU3V9B4_9RHOB|nr:Crp/Fnr family transcriptional regulator [Sedimentitalea todarodis]MDU9002369.1 Crp/Fnr family transcriptional regulator [Sedimentitalea todarodis]
MQLDLKTADSIFKSHGWLATCPESVRRKVLETGRVRRFAASETLYRLGEISDGVYGIVEGRVVVSIPSDAGTIYDCYIGRPGFWIGDLALFSKSTRLVSLTAETDVTCWFLPQTRLHDLIRADPDLICLFYALTHRNMATTMRIMANLTIPDNARRLAAWLLFQDDQMPSTGCWIEASQEQIAMQNIVSPPTVRRLLRRLQEKGLIELRYGKVRVANHDRLLAFSRA